MSSSDWTVGHRGNKNEGVSITSSYILLPNYFYIEPDKKCHCLDKIFSSSNDHDEHIEASNDVHKTYRHVYKAIVKYCIPNQENYFLNVFN